MAKPIKLEGKKPTVKIAFTDFWEPDMPGIISPDMIKNFLSQRFNLEISEKPDFLIYSKFGQDFQRFNCVRIFYTAENVRPNFNECDFAFSFDYPITDKNYRLPLYKLIEQYQKIKAPKNIGQLSAEKNKFCNFIYSNPVHLRNRFFEQLSKYRKIDAPGVCMNNMPPIGAQTDPFWSRYSTPWVNEKLRFLKPYKFTIAFENSSFPGYTTEKIVHAFAANSIPVYWGNPLISKEFNPKAFINCHDFNSFGEVIEHVKLIDQDENLYRQMLSEPAVAEEGLTYLETEEILNRFERIFTTEHTRLAAKPIDYLKWSVRTNWRSLKKNLRIG